ncbi:hypothetical protein Smic_78740 [Streptomyces microflavus]|uniref:TIGR02677 family protein n=1 Tax=Streptomyces microflavus TaxID=1919 RepID=A0A7J0D3P6_STRMI|nr:hypothetical protein Smic_78740 [Streptomyces microflavus]
MTSTTAPGPGPDGFSPFAHLTVQNTALYRQVTRAFVMAKEHFAVHLRPEDVYAALPGEVRPGELDGVVKALDKLVEWGNLRADPDTGRVSAVEDFYRKRFIYQLTRAGEAAEEALAAYDEALGRRGALQAIALHDIVTQLRALLVLTADEQPDPGKTYLAFDALASRFAALADNARAFMSSLQRTIDLHEVEEAVFLAYKDRLIQYLERFIQDLITLGGRIAQLILELEDSGRIEVLLRATAMREAADAAPEDAEPAAQRAYAHWAGRWEGLAVWFLSRDGRESQARLLRGRALGAIPQMLAVVRVLGNAEPAGRTVPPTSAHSPAGLPRPPTMPRDTSCGGRPSDSTPPGTLRPTPTPWPPAWPHRCPQPLPGPQRSRCGSALNCAAPEVTSVAASPARLRTARSIVVTSPRWRPSRWPRPPLPGTASSPTEPSDSPNSASSTRSPSGSSSNCSATHWPPGDPACGTPWPPATTARWRSG